MRKGGVFVFLFALFLFLTLSFVSAVNAPGNPSATVLSSRNISLTWTDTNNGQAAYGIAPSFDGVDFNSWGIFVPQGQTSYVMSAMCPNTTLYFKIVATIGADKAYSSIVSGTTPRGIPNVPSAYGATLVSLNSADVFAGSGGEYCPDDLLYYSFERANSFNGPFVYVGTVANVTDYVNTGLTAGNTYYYRINRTADPTSLVFIGSSGYSNVINVTLGVPPSLTNLVAVAESPTTIHLSWVDPANNDNGIIIERSIDSPNGPFVQVGSVEYYMSLKYNTFYDTDVTSLHTYYYRLHSYNVYGNSTYLYANAAPVGPSPPNTPTGLVAFAVSASEVKLGWSDNSAGGSNEQGFSIFRSDSPNGIFSAIGAVPGDEVYYFDSNLSAGTTYYYKVNAFNSQGSSSFSQYASTMTLLIPSPPSDLVVGWVSSNQINVSWKNNSVNQGYYIERSRSPLPDAFTQIASVGSGTNSYLDNDVSDGYDYTYRIRAYNSYGTSRYAGPTNSDNFDWVFIFTYGINQSIPFPSTAINYLCNQSFISKINSWFDRASYKYQASKPFNRILCVQQQQNIPNNYWGQAGGFLLDPSNVIDYLENNNSVDPDIFAAVRNAKHVTVFHYDTFLDNPYGLFGDVINSDPNNKKYNFVYIMPLRGTNFATTNKFDPTFDNIDNYAYVLSREFLYSIGASQKCDAACSSDNPLTGEKYCSLDVMRNTAGYSSSTNTYTNLFDNVLVTSPTARELGWLTNYHGADVNSDGRIDQAEMNNYNDAFKKGLLWLGGSISQADATRVNYIYNKGGYYGYNLSVSCPGCWQSISSSSNSAPTGLKVNTVQARQVNLVWDPSPGALSYNIYRSFDGNSYNRIATGIVALAYPDTGLIPGTGYYYEISVNRSSGESLLSQAIGVMTPKDTPILSISASPGANVNYSTQITVIGNGCPAELTCTLTRNGRPVSNPPNQDVQTLGEGTYIYYYYTPGNSHYDQGYAYLIVNVSRYYSLSVTKVGNGFGSVTAYQGGINCGAVCSADYLSGTGVDLSAVPDIGYVFSGWSNVCFGTGGCHVNMNVPLNAIANFSTQVFTLTFTRPSNGRVTSGDGKIDCGTSTSICSASYSTGQSVTLTASPDSGYSIGSWSGDCSSASGNSCLLTINSNKNAGVQFSQITYALSVSKAGSGTGIIMSNVGGINCGSTCSANYAPGTNVILTANPDQFMIFAGWSGACSGTGTCSLTMNSAKTATATFNAPGAFDYTLYNTGINVTRGTSVSQFVNVTKNPAAAQPVTVTIDTATLPSGVSLTSGNVLSCTPNSGSCVLMFNYTITTSANLGSYDVGITGSTTGTTDKQLSFPMGVYDVTSDIPPAPTGLQGYRVTPTQIFLYWNPSPGATTYKVYRGTASFKSLVGSPNVNYFVDSGLSSTITYYYGISSVGSGYPSARSTDVIVPPV